MLDFSIIFLGLRQKIVAIEVIDGCVWRIFRFCSDYKVYIDLAILQAFCVSSNLLVLLKMLQKYCYHVGEHEKYSHNKKKIGLHRITLSGGRKEDIQIKIKSRIIPRWRILIYLSRFTWTSYYGSPFLSIRYARREVVVIFPKVPSNGLSKDSRKKLKNP